MDERTRILVSLGAATAANCVSCFDHYFERAEAVGLPSEEIKEVAEIADQVKRGAHITTRNAVGNRIAQGTGTTADCCATAGGSCCE
ncbi:MAG: carboxymuconolactone decarboxylase family protein [Deltaproteobacteria bacterium]